MTVGVQGDNITLFAALCMFYILVCDWFLVRNCLLVVVRIGGVWSLVGLCELVCISIDIRLINRLSRFNPYANRACLAAVSTIIIKQMVKFTLPGGPLSTSLE